MGNWKTFINALCEGFRPIRTALPTILAGAVAMTLLLLTGAALVHISRSMDHPFDLMIKIAGEGFIAAGGLAGLATTVRAWWLMFDAAGFLERRP